MEELVVDAVVENVDEVTDYVLDQLKAVGCDKKTLVRASVVVDEIFSNIAFYAYRPRVGSVTVRARVLENPPELVMTFVDDGVPFNPLELEDPQIDASIDERDMGGLGILLVKKNMDQVSYEYANNQNILTLRKYLSES